MSKKIYNQDKMYAGNFSINFFDGLSIGSISTYAGDDTPDGCLVCDGSAVLRTTYSELFAVIGTKFGAGDGTSTFNLPNIIDPTTPALKHLIKAKSGSKSINNATNTNMGFIRLATDDEAENSVLEDVAINPKQFKLALPKTSLRSKIYGTDTAGGQTLYNETEYAKKTVPDVPYTVLTLPDSIIGGGIWYQVKNGMVSIQCNGAQPNTTGLIVINFPAQYRPKTSQYCSVATSYGDPAATALFYVDNQGIKLKGSKANEGVYGSVSYMI